MVCSLLLSMEAMSKLRRLASLELSAVKAVTLLMAKESAKKAFTAPKDRTL